MDVDGRCGRGPPARIATVEHLQTAEIARLMQWEKLQRAYDLHHAHTRDRHAASALVFGGLGYRPPFPADLRRAADAVVADEARYLAGADLYVLTPQMCDVVVAAAQTLTVADLELLVEDDLPAVSGLVLLPHPLIVTTVGGNLGDLRGFTWHTPSQIQLPDADMTRLEDRPAVRISVYNDTHGPVRPNSFLTLAAQARAIGTPLPPLLLDAIRCFRSVTRPPPNRSKNSRTSALSRARPGRPSTTPMPPTASTRTGSPVNTPGQPDRRPRRHVRGPVPVCVLAAV